MNNCNKNMMINYYNKNSCNHKQINIKMKINGFLNNFKIKMNKIRN